MQLKEFGTDTGACNPTVFAGGVCEAPAVIMKVPAPAAEVEIGPDVETLANEPGRVPLLSVVPVTVEVGRSAAGSNPLPSRGAYPFAAPLFAVLSTATPPRRRPELR